VPLIVPSIALPHRSNKRIEGEGEGQERDGRQSNPQLWFGNLSLESASNSAQVGAEQIQKQIQFWGGRLG
jgi:hypothetical protein